jgi:hypothetical protein
MEWMDVAVLVMAGLAGGFVGGLVGVGGGVIFAPVLFFYLQAQGVTDPTLTPLTIGSSLFGTLVTSGVSARAQHLRGAVDWRIASLTGLSSAVVVLAMTWFVTTRPWYDATVFQVVFSAVLVWVGLRMLLARPEREGPVEGRSVKGGGGLLLAGMGSVAGAVSAAVGVGGGVVLVPAYHELLHLPMHRSVGTSSASIVFIALIGVLAYVATGWDQPVPPTALGYVDVGAAVVLSVAAAGAARLGVTTAHRVNTLWLERAFAVLVFLVAARLVLRVLGM